MKISAIQYGTNFKGYDVMPLRGLYMQGWENYNFQKITKEMSEIAQKENIPLYINNYGKVAKDTVKSIPCLYDSFSVWAQDTKNFLYNKGLSLMCNLREAVLKKENLGELSDYQINYRKNLPRGGNFYIGYKPNGEKWMLVSSKTIMGDLKSIYHDGHNDSSQLKGLWNSDELVKKSEITSIFGIKNENIYLINTLYDDLDMIIRPIGYPYVLVNDCDSTFENIMELQDKNTNNKNKIGMSEMYVNSQVYSAVLKDVTDSLKEYGFIPIKIGGAYSNNINFMNALAFRTKNGGISYITNSTRDSNPSLEGLEKIFEEKLRESVDNIENVYFVSGGNAVENGFKNANRSDINSMMHWLGENKGGIHCMTAEIPDFDKIA